jgi:hypothetical protein
LAAEEDQGFSTNFIADFCDPPPEQAATNNKRRKGKKTKARENLIGNMTTLRI